ncbi:Uncharacterised protein [Bordetella pertussis]|nr:Uncharacterised protein [Bordetella pertussis]
MYRLRKRSRLTALLLRPLSRRSMSEFMIHLAQEDFLTLRYHSHRSRTCFSV